LPRNAFVGRLRPEPPKELTALPSFVARLKGEGKGIGGEREKGRKERGKKPLNAEVL